MIKFGPSGNSESFYAEGHEHTEEAARFVRERGLDCFEYSFGRGVRITAEKAHSVRDAFADMGVEISVHAPYFVNLANPDEEMAEKSFGYILESARAAREMGARRIVFHPAAQGKEERDTAVRRTEERLKILRDKIYEEGFSDLYFCPETMGKVAQIGTIEEIVRFSELDPVFVPCVDFGHVNAREQGSLKTEEDYSSRLRFMLSELGREKMELLHVHFSKIMYGPKGELKHLTFEDREYGPEFEPFARALHALGLQPYIVSESAGTQAEDAAEMKRIYALTAKG